MKEEKCTEEKNAKVKEMFAEETNPKKKETRKRETGKNKEEKGKNNLEPEILPADEKDKSVEEQIPKEGKTDRNRQDKQRIEKLLDKLTLFDDELMTSVFDGNIPATELLLQLVLKKKVKVKSVKAQYTMPRTFHQGKSITLDIKAEDMKGNQFDVEVQAESEGSEVQRARFHSSMLDVRMLKKGSKFTGIKDSYVIFIYKHDKFHEGLPVYHLERMVCETGKQVNDGSHILYVNGAYKGKDNIGKLIHDFNCSKPDDMNFPELADKVRDYKETRKGREGMSKLVEEYGDEREARGRKEGRIQLLTDLINDNILKVSDAAKRMNMTEEEFMKSMKAEMSRR